jgi:hypothetical protein
LARQSVERFHQKALCPHEDFSAVDFKVAPQILRRPALQIYVQQFQELLEIRPT